MDDRSPFPRFIVSILTAGFFLAGGLAAEPAELVYVPGSTRRVCQLTGDFDRPARKPTLNQTGKRFGVHATDLGSSFEHKGKLYFLKPFGRYVLLYNAEKPRGITMRSAPSPWGPWSDGAAVFDPWRDNGYGHFMHISSEFKDRRDALSDPGQTEKWGGEYGPYIMSRYTTGRAGAYRVYYTMSTWNPYQVVVMQTDLVLKREGE